MPERKYDFNDFMVACGDRQRVSVHKRALDGAIKDFNLKSEEALLSFINNKGLENLRFINAKPWEKNPEPENPIQVEAYEFKSVHTLGYIAFFYSDKRDKWIIKSFKRNENSSTVISDAYKKARKCIDVNKKGENLDE